MSKQWYCHSCAAKKNLLANPPTNLTGSSYQLDKYIKHTQPTSSYDINSVFDDPSYDTYAAHTVNACCSGSVEVDEKGRTNIVWAAGKTVGWTLFSGLPSCDCDAVKVVLAHDHHRIHPYATGSLEARAETCCECGEPVVV